jgi:fatty acid-binding protein DegV
MSVKIVTDSTSDLPKEVAEELGITVVPLNVHFDLDTFKDGVDIHAEQFYHRLLTTPTLPKTSAPSPGIFSECYTTLAEDSQEIVSIHISSKLSGTYEAALVGKQDVTKDCRIEVIESGSATMGLGLIAVAAAKAAQEGAGIDDITKLVHDSADRGYVAWMGSILSIKPIISLAEGEVVPLERVRTHTKAVTRMYDLLEEHLPAKELAVIYSTDAEEARRMVFHLKEVAPQQQVRLACFGPVLGTYVGPNSLGIAALN